MEGALALKAAEEPQAAPGTGVLRDREQHTNGAGHDTIRTEHTVPNAAQVALCPECPGETVFSPTSRSRLSPPYSSSGAQESGVEKICTR